MTSSKRIDACINREKRPLIRSDSGITLIELIAVIAIIAMLAGIILPAVSKARRHAIKVAARTETKQIETAWRQYLAEYGAWPSNFMESSAYAVTGALARALGGEAAGTLNPRKIPFLNFARRDPDQNPVNPWAKPSSTGGKNWFFCRFDTDYNGSLSGTGNPTNPPMSEMARQVIVWTLNPDAKDDDPDYIVGSWQQ